MTILYSTTLIISSILYLIIQKYFIRKGVYDKVKDRSSHNVSATRSGGASIFATLFIITIYLYITSNQIFDFSLFIPLGILFTVGLYDDIYQVDFKLKFIFQIIAAKIIIDNGLIIDNLHGVFGVYEINRVIAQLVTIFFIISIINSINFIDGIDGLASSIVCMFLILFEFFIKGTSSYFYLSLILVSSIAPLFFFNFRKKNKIFLGDSGSLFLGGIVSIYVISILSQDYVIKSEYDLHKIIFVLSILIYPVLDITRIFFNRILSGKSPFVADKNHIHHLILSKTQSHIKTTLIIVSLSLVFLVVIQLINNAL